MTSRRIALVLDPITLASKAGEHPPQLAAELLGRGHVVRGFGAPPGLIPRSGDEMEDGAAAPTTLPGFRPDVIVAYDALSSAAFRGARAARKLDCGLVLVEADPPGGGRLHERLLWRAGEWLWGSYVRRTAHAVVALDPVARARALEEGFDRTRISILPHGVDPSRFRPGLTSQLVANHRIRGRILLYVGRIELDRGLETLVAAFARTVGQREDWSLVLAGEGSARLKLRAMCDRLGVASKVHWLSRPRREELPGLLGASTLLAVPALDDRVLGRVVIRAMAAGLPVIASDLERLRFLVRPEETGLLAKAGDVGAWAAAIRRAAGSPVVRRRWGSRARAIAEERLSWSGIAEAFEALLADACERSRVNAAREQAAKA